MAHIRIAGIVNESIVDGPGIRYTIFTQGCKHHCLGCHNPNTHDFRGGSDKEISEIVTEIKSNVLLDGVTFSGGDPIEQTACCLEIIDGLAGTLLDYIVYTGYTWEQLLEMGEDDPSILELLSKIDYLIDGKFILSLRDISLDFRGSTNQRIIDTKASLKSGQVILASFKVE